MGIVVSLFARSEPMQSIFIFLGILKDQVFNNKFYSHQLMHFFIQLCISLLSYIQIT